MEQQKIDVYPVGWLAALQFARNTRSTGGLTYEWKYMVHAIKARRWRSVRNMFNGYLAEMEGASINAGHGWTKGRAERRVRKLATAAGVDLDRRGAARILWDGSNSTEVADFLGFKNRDNLDTTVKFTVGFTDDGAMKVADVGDSIIRHDDGVYSVDHAVR